uniref:Uncharacterized protein n=1 Tax=Anguilla anguilla TaxID=7936 RepID=A0A0E9SXJ9_ANGAN
MYHDCFDVSETAYLFLLPVLEVNIGAYAYIGA